MNSRQYIALNNYSVTVSLSGALRGVMPRHHCYGVDRLIEEGCDVVAIERESSLAARAGRRLVPRRLGAWLDPLQLSCGYWRAARTTGTIYALNAYVLGNVPLGRVFGTRRPPIVAVVGDAFGGRYARYLAHNIDAAICLTEKAAETLASNGLRDTIFAPWGPDLSFKGYESVPPDQFRLVALGRTARDLDTLISAIGLENVDSILEVPSGTALPPGAVSLGDLASASGYTKFEEGSYLRPGVAFRQASVFAVPLHQGFGGPVGLTEANDALALGRPIIMTRTQGLGFDIEKEGMGIWVDPRDVEGWRNAIRLLRDDIGLRRQMGVNARRFAESQWNNTIFSTKLNAFLLQTGL